MFPDRGDQRARAAIERADYNLADAPPDAGADYQTARELLGRRDQLLDHFRELADIAAQFDATAARSRERNSGQDYRLEL